MKAATIATYAMAFVAMASAAQARSFKGVDGPCRRDGSAVSEDESIRGRTEAWRAGAERWLSRKPDHRFEEKGYLACNPDVASLIRQGRYKTAVEHYCGTGLYEGRKSACVGKAKVRIPDR